MIELKDIILQAFAAYIVSVVVSSSSLFHRPREIAKGNRLARDGIRADHHVDRTVGKACAGDRRAGATDQVHRSL